MSIRSKIYDSPRSNSSPSIANPLIVDNGGTGANAFTQGSVIFAGLAGVYSQDNTNFFWDNTNKRLGIGTNSPGAKFHITDNYDGFRSIAHFSNPNAGVNAVSSIGIGANGANGIDIGILGTTCTAYPTYGQANSTHLYVGNSIDGLNILTGAGGAGNRYIRFYPGIAANDASGSVLSMINTRYIGINVDVPTAALEVVGTGSGSGTYTAKFHNSSGTSNSLVIDNAGNIGIGTIAPLDQVNIFNVSGAVMRLSSSITSYARIVDLAGNQFQIYKYNAAGSVAMDLNPMPVDGTSIAQVRLFRLTSTSAVKSFDIYKGDGTSTLDASIRVGADSYFNVSSGFVGIGTGTPLSDLYVLKKDNASNAIISAFANNLTSGVLITYKGVQMAGSAANLNLQLTPQGTGNVYIDAHNLSIGSTTSSSRLYVVKDDNGTGAIISALTNNLSAGMALTWKGLQVIGANTDIDLHLIPKGAGNLFVDSGNVGINGVTSFGTAAAGVFAQANGTAPSTDISTQYQLYSLSGKPHFRTGAGDTIIIQKGAAIADAAGGATVDAEARTAINTLLAQMRVTGGNGFIAN